MMALIRPYRLAEPVIQQNPIRQSSERIMLRQMGHLVYERVGVSYVPKNQDGSHYVTFGIADGCGRILDSGFEAVAADQHTVCRKTHSMVLINRILQRVARGLAAFPVHNPKHLDKRPA